MSQPIPPTAPASARPLRVAIVAWRFPMVSETFVLDHVTGLIERGHEVQVFAEAPGPDAGHAEVAGYGLPQRTHYWPALPVGAAALAPLPGLLTPRSALALARGGFSRPALRRGIERLLRARALRVALPQADIVHAHFGGVGEALAWMRACGALPARLVVSLHGYDVLRREGGGLPRYEHLFAHADRIVATTQFLAGGIRRLVCPAPKIAQRPIGIRLQHFPFKARARTPGEPLRLLSVARLVEKKGIEYAIRAAAQLQGQGVDLRYRVVGDGPLREPLRQLARELGIAEQVEFVGAQAREAVSEEYARCHVFLFPSVTAADGDEEGQGMAALEAQACGIPLVATRHGGIPEVVVEGKSGLLVPERDAGALAAALRHLLQCEPQWPAMGAAGRRFVEQAYTQEHYMQFLEQVYRELMAA